jgi:dCTP diphosphatase
MKNESGKNDTNTTLDELKGIIAKFISERDWDKYHHPKEVAVSLSVEVGELLEIFQWMERLP